MKGDVSYYRIIVMLLKVVYGSEQDILSVVLDFGIYIYTFWVHNIQTLVNALHSIKYRVYLFAGYKLIALNRVSYKVFVVLLNLNIKCGYDWCSDFLSLFFLRKWNFTM